MILWLCRLLVWVGFWQEHVTASHKSDFTREQPTYTVTPGVYFSRRTEESHSSRLPGPYWIDGTDFIATGPTVRTDEMWRPL